MLARYEIRVAGQLSKAEAAAFDGLDVAILTGVTVIRGEFDQAGLHGVLERIRMLGLELIDARRVRSSPPTGSTMPWTGAGAPLPDDRIGRTDATMAGLRCGREEISVSCHAYAVRVAGSLGRSAREAFADVAIDVEPNSTVLSAELDQVGLHALLDRVRALGLELIDIEQAPDPPPPRP